MVEKFGVFSCKQAALGIARLTMSIFSLKLVLKLVLDETFCFRMILYIMYMY